MADPARVPRLTKLSDKFREIGARAYVWLNKLTVFLVAGFVVFKLVEVILGAESTATKNYFACKTEEVYGGLRYSKIMGAEVGAIKLLKVHENWSAIVTDFRPEISQQLAEHDATQRLDEAQADFGSSFNVGAELLKSNWTRPVSWVYKSSSTNDEILIERRWDPILQRNNLARWDGERFNEVLLYGSSLLFTETERGSELNERTPVSRGRCVPIPRLLFELELERQEYDAKFVALDAMRDALSTKFSNVGN